jgi:hypothetical protein
MSAPEPPRSSSGNSPPRLSRPRAVIAFTCALVFGPIAADLSLSGPGRPFAYFVPLFHQGHWYCPIGALFPSLLVLRFASKPTQWLERSGARVAAAGLLSVAVVLVYFVVLQRKHDYNQNYARFFLDEAPRVVAHYKGERPRFLSKDDGIVAFATGFPTMSLALALDPEGARSFLAGRHGELALARGFDRFTSFDYMNLSAPLSSRLVKHIVRDFGLSSADNYKFTTEYRSPAARFGVVPVEPAAPR